MHRFAFVPGGGLLLAFFLLIDIGGARAEGSAGLYDVISAIMPGRTIRIEVFERGRVTGTFQRNTADSLFMEIDDREYPFLLTQVDKLWVREHASKDGMVIGAGFGLIAVGAASEDFSAFGGFAGGVWAGFLGSLIGMAVPQWELRYDSPPSFVHASVPIGDDAPPFQTGPLIPSSWALEAMGGYASDGMDTWYGARYVWTADSGFRWGVEASGFGKPLQDEFRGEGSERLISFSLLIGPSLRLAGTRVYLMLGPSLLSEKIEWEDIDQEGYEETNAILGFAAAPGVRVGGTRWHVFVEGKYQAMERGYYDDVIGVLGGAGVDF